MAAPPYPTTNGNGTRSTGLIATNNVTWEKHTVRARIDPTLSVADVIKQLCLNLKIQESSTNFALRDEGDQLVTNENLRKMIKAKSNLKCVHIGRLVRHSLKCNCYCLKDWLMLQPLRR